MKDKLLYLTIGALVGIAVMQWAVTQQQIIKPVQAGTNFSATGFTAADAHSSSFVLLDENGDRWQFTPDSVWQQRGGDPLPIPVRSIKFYLAAEIPYELIISLSDEAWVWQSVDPGSPGYQQWQSVGTWPGPSVPTESSTFGTLKGQYQGKDNQ